MRFFDLHCDTLYEVTENKKNFFKNDLHVSIDRGCNLTKWFECFAVWVPDTVRADNAISLFNRCKKKFDELVKQTLSTNLTPILTVEGGAALAGDIDRVNYLKDAGVKMMTLTWNGACEIGDGVLVKRPCGLTDFGKQCVKRMQDIGMMVDISHASEKLFWEVIDISKMPVVASHSNSKKICNNNRNIDDEQFKAIKNINGLVGVTLCNRFLKDPGKASVYDLLKHVDHFLSLGGENIISIGTDFDGTDILDGINGIQNIDSIYEEFLKHNYKEQLIKNIFFENAHKFFKKFDLL